MEIENVHRFYNELHSEGLEGWRSGEVHLPLQRTRVGSQHSRGSINCLELQTDPVFSLGLPECVHLHIDTCTHTHKLKI